MSSILLEANNVPIWNENDEEFGRREDVFLCVRSTPGARPRVRRASIVGRGTQVVWREGLIPRPNVGPGFAVYELQGGTTEAGFYEVTVYPTRISHYIRVVTTGSGTMRTSYACRFNNQHTAERAVLQAISFQNVSGQIVLYHSPSRGPRFDRIETSNFDPFSEETQVVSKKGRPRPLETASPTPRDRFNRILELDLVTEAAPPPPPDPFKDASIEEVLELEMAIIELEKSAEKAQNKSFSESELEAIIKELKL